MFVGEQVTNYYIEFDTALDGYLTTQQMIDQMFIVEEYMRNVCSACKNPLTLSKLDIIYFPQLLLVFLPDNEVKFNILEDNKIITLKDHQYHWFLKIEKYDHEERFNDDESLLVKHCFLSSYIIDEWTLYDDVEKWKDMKEKYFTGYTKETKVITVFVKYLNFVSF